MATSEAGLVDELREELTAYREGDTLRRTVWGALELALGLAIILRIAIHAMAYGALVDGEHPLEVEYGLTLGLQVRDPVTPNEAAQIRLATSGCALLTSIMSINRTLTGPLGVLLVANWLFLIGDPLWGLLDRDDSHD